MKAMNLILFADILHFVRVSVGKCYMLGFTVFNKRTLIKFQLMSIVKPRNVETVNCLDSVINLMTNIR